MPCLRLLPGLLLLAACGSGGGSSADDTTGTSPATATEPGDTGATTAVTGGGTTADATDPVTTSATGTAATTGPGETTTGTPGTTAGTTGEPGTGTPDTTTTGDPSTGDATTGGAVGACQAVGDDHGPCDALIGWAFVGDGCQLLSGCSCEPDCALFFDDAVSCATTCAAAGECRLDKIHGGGIAPDEVGPGSFCDEVDTCVHPNELAELFPGLSCEPQGQPCGGEVCHLLFAGELTPELWEQVCAASLLPGVDELTCMVFGP